MCFDILLLIPRALKWICDVLGNANTIRDGYAQLQSARTRENFTPDHSVPSVKDNIRLDFDDPQTQEGALKLAVLQDSNVVGAVARGSGGVGKTCALMGLANLQEITDRFPGGRYWISLGADATVQDFINQLAEIVRCSGGEAESDAILAKDEISKAITLAQEWFRPHTCLFVIDDVWACNHIPVDIVRMFSRLCSNNRKSRILYSSRDDRIASYGREVPFRPLVSDNDNAKAKEILLCAAGASADLLRDTNAAPHINQILNICHGLQQTLNIAGSAIAEISADHRPPAEVWKHYAMKFKANADQLISDDRDDKSLKAASRVSLEVIGKMYGDVFSRSHCRSFEEVIAALSVSQKRESVPYSVLDRLWGSTSNGGTAKIVQALKRFSLVDATIFTNKSGDTVDAILIHDHLNDFAVEEAAASSEYCAAFWAQKIIDSYRGDINASAGDPCWPAKITDDEYFSKNVCRLLLCAGLDPTAKTLLMNPRWIVKMLREKSILQLEQDMNLLLTTDNLLTDDDKEIVSIMARLARLSVPLCADSENAIWFQLYSRLVAANPKKPWMDRVMNEIRRHAVRPWLRAVTPCFPNPFTPLINVFPLKGLDGIHVKFLQTGDMAYLHIAFGGRRVCLTVVGSDSDASETSFQLGEDASSDERISACAISGDGRTVVCATEREGWLWTTVRTVRVWDAETKRQVLCRRTGHNGAIGSIATDGQRRKVVTGSDDKTIRIFDINDKKETVGPLKGHSREVRAVAVSADGTRVASGSDDNTVRVWNAADGSEVCTPLAGHTGVVRSVAMSADGTRVASGSDDNTVRVWNAADGSEVCTPLAGHTGMFPSVAMSADGTRVASGSHDTTVRVWNAADGSEVCTPLAGHTDWVLSVAMSADGTRVASGSHDNTVRVWNAADGSEVCTPLAGHTGVVGSVAMSADGTRVASGCHDKTVRVWDAADGSEVCTPLAGHTDWVLSVAMSADGTRVASGSDDNTVRVWNAADGSEVCTPLAGHTSWVLSVAMSADGTRVASGSHDNTVRVWNAADGSEVCTPLACHTGVVLSVAMSADGTRVASGSHDNTVRVWNAADGWEVCTPLAGHTGWVRSVAMSADGTRVVSRDWEDTVRLWDAGIGSCILCEDSGESVSSAALYQALCREHLQGDSLVPSVPRSVYRTEWDDKIIEERAGGARVVAQFDSRIAGDGMLQHGDVLVVGLASGAVGILHVEE